MALIPQIAGTASFARNTAPVCFSSNATGLIAEGALFTASLWKLIPPNWSVDEFDPLSFALVPLMLFGASEFERTL